MMDQLVSAVSEKTGLSPDQTKSAVDAVLGFVKEKLPGPIADNLEGILAGEENDSDSSNGSGLLGTAVSALGSMFGKDK